MRLGLTLGYWGAQNDVSDLALGVLADRLGYDIVWSAEAYGSDAVSVLGWLAAKTEQIELGSAIMQIPGRSAAMTVMTAATLDTLSAGRFTLGLGVSGPQVSEGWHGVAFAKPLARTREYVDIVRLGLSRSRLAYAGTEFVLPLPGGAGKALALTFTPQRPSIPVYLAVVGPASLRLTGEIADGWLSAFLSPESAAESIAALDLERRDGRPFDVVAQVPAVVGDDLAACADLVRPHVALYVGGMGARGQNFYLSLAERMGYGREARQVQELYLDGQRAAAEAALPFDFLDQTSLLGPPERIADRMLAFAASGVTTLTAVLSAVPPDRRGDTVRAVAAAYERSGLRGSAVPAPVGR
jgi:F420-dependent oxidoreductase-like protein